MSNLENGWPINVRVPSQKARRHAKSHLVVEMNRLLTGMIQVVQEVDTNTGVALCNEVGCPTMSAGRYAVFEPHLAHN
jgi:hypothetical protein